ncbi:MAG TPA: Wzz/FepE/Etk N-terminal domain-containing protein [Novosphingobium sp.]
MTSSNDSEQPSGNPEFFSHLPVILGQHWRILVATTLLGLALATAIAFVIPETYRSSALLIVQSSQLPSDVTGQGPGQGEIIDRRIARIRQQIISRPDLTALIVKHDLYAGARSSQSMTKIIKDMRTAIVLEPTAAELPGNADNQRTVAVKLSFDYSNAAKAQAVAQDLMQKLLDLDSRGNVQQANNAAQFLDDQAKTLEAQIRDVEGRMAQVAGANGRALAARGITMMGGGGGSYDVQIAALQRDNATLLAQKEAARTADGRDPMVVAAEAQLATARAQYSDNHPDVAMARQRLAEARRLARANMNPAGSSVDNQIEFNNAQIAQLRAAKGAEQAQVSASLSAQSRAPMVEQQLGQLQQQLTGLNQQYQTISAKLMAARAGVKADDQQISERLSVAEPPVVPDRPDSPNRPLLMGMGVLIGLALGLALILFFELQMRPIRSPKMLAQLAGVEPLGVVPVIGPLQPAVRQWGISPASYWTGLRSDVRTILGRSTR